MSTETQYVGLSLVFCIADIYEGRIRVDNMHSIVISSRLPINELLDLYKNQNSWDGFYEEAETIVYELYHADRIRQPQIDESIPGYNTEIGHRIGRGWWLDVKEGRQFCVTNTGEKRYSLSLDQGVDVILTQIRKKATERLLSRQGIHQNAGSLIAR